MNMEQRNGIVELNSIINLLQQYLAPYIPFSELENTLTSYINEVTLLTNTVSKHKQNGLVYSPTEHARSFEIYQAVNELWKKMTAIDNLKEIVDLKMKKLKPLFPSPLSLPKELIDRYSKADTQYKEFCKTLGDGFVKLYNDIETLQNSYNAIEYYNYHIKECKNKDYSLMDEKKCMEALDLASKTYSQLGSIALAKRRELMYLNNDTILKTCASDFANYILDNIAEKSIHSINYLELINEYFFGNGSFSYVYNLTQQLLKDHGSNGYFDNLYLRKNDALGYKYIRKLNHYTNAIMFSPNTNAYDKVKAYLLLVNCVKNYNKCINGLLGKCTYEDYVLTDKQKEKASKSFKNESITSFAELITFLKEKYKQDSGYKNIVDFTKSIKENYIVQHADANIEKEISID